MSTAASGPPGRPRRRRRPWPGEPSAAQRAGAGGRRGLPDVPGIQLGQALMPAAPRGGQDQLHGRPVLPGLLGHLGQVADRQLLTVQRQVVERPPGSAGHVVRELHLGLDPLGRGVGLEDRGHLGVSRGQAGQLLRLLQAPLGGLELEARGAAPRRDVAAPAERVRGVGGQVTGHLGQVVVAGRPKPTARASAVAAAPDRWPRKSSRACTAASSSSSARTASRQRSASARSRAVSSRSGSMR